MFVSCHSGPIASRSAETCTVYDGTLLQDHTPGRNETSDRRRCLSTRNSNPDNGDPMSHAVTHSPLRPDTGETSPLVNRKSGAVVAPLKRGGTLNSKL